MENDGFQKGRFNEHGKMLDEPPGKNQEAMTDKRETSNSIIVLTHSSDQQNYKQLKMVTKVCSTQFVFSFSKKVNLSNCEYFCNRKRDTISDCTKGRCFQVLRKFRYFSDKPGLMKFTFECLRYWLE